MKREGPGRAATLAGVARDARLTRGYLLQIVLSTAIAHLGLLMNSPPVIIGAMLISPLLGPIMGLGFAVAVFDERLLRRSLTTLGVGTLAAIMVAALLTLVSPITDATPALLSRVRPSLLDLLVAIFGGVAGGYALLRRSSATMVGVAIATALIPALATIGWALVAGRLAYSGGALLLYITNTTAIALMIAAVARFNGYGRDLSPQQTGLQTIGLIAVLGILAVPLGLSLSSIVREAQATAALRETLSDMTGDEATIDRFEIDFLAQEPSVSAVVIAPRFVPGLEQRFARVAQQELGSGTHARVIQLRSGSTEARESRSAGSQQDDLPSLAGREMQRLRAALAVAFGINGDAVLIDAQRRTAVVRMPTTKDSGRAPPTDDPTDAATEADARNVPDLAPLRAAFPDWSIEVVRPVRLDSASQRAPKAPAVSPT
jgi:uncharacterized hydrophobic protein (TIGR00271 family)